MLGAVSNWLGFTGTEVSRFRRDFSKKSLEQLCTHPQARMQWSTNELARIAKATRKMNHPKADEIQSLYEERVRREIVKKVPSLIDCVQKKATPKAATTEGTVFKSGDMRIKDIIAYLEKEGKKLTGIELSHVNDKLLNAIADNCPNLTSLSMNYGVQGMPRATTKGIEAIGRLTNLTSLHTSQWFFLDYEISDFTKLLSLSHFQQNLVSLRIDEFDGKESPLMALRDYKKLERLTIDNGSAEVMATVLGFPSIKKTVRELSLSDFVSFNDSTLAALHGYQLETFSAWPFQGISEPTWSATPEALKRFLESYNLRALTLGYRVPLDDASASAIQNMSNLQQLAIYNCSKLTKELSFEKLSELRELTLFKLNGPDSTIFTTGGVFGDKQLTQLASLSLTSLALEFLSSYEITEEKLHIFAATKTLRDSLRHLQVKGLNYFIKEGGFNWIGNFALESLRIRECRWFNDCTIQALANMRIAYSLETLEVKKHSLTDNSIAELANFPKLKTLAFINNAAMGSVIESLLASEALQSRLELLGITDVKFTYNSAKEFLSKFTKLRVLNLANSDLPDDDYYKLRDEFPHVDFGISMGYNIGFYNELDFLGYIDQTVKPESEVGTST